MLKKHKNQILFRINKSGLDAHKFELKEFDESVEITFKDSPLDFSFYYDDTSIYFYKISHVPLSKSYSVYYLDDLYDFEKALLIFEGWLESSVKVYIENMNDIDLWETMKLSSELIHPNFIDFEDQSYFSDLEKEQIKLTIDKIINLVPEKFELSSGEYKTIVDQLNYLKEKVDTLNKFDWKNLMVGIATSLALNMFVDREVGISFFEFFKSMFISVTLFINN